MRTRTVAILVLGLSAGAATAQTKEVMKLALGEVASELQQCSAYYLIASSCIASQEPDLAGTFRGLADKASDLAITGLRATGMSDEAYIARSSLVTGEMMNSMSRSCTNIAILVKKYANFCQRLSRGTDWRIHEWVECAQASNRTCGAP